MKTNNIFPLLAMIAALLCAHATVSLAGKDATNTRDTAATILSESGVQGGLIVHIGSGDGELTAALRANDSCIVHGLDTDAGDIDKANASHSTGAVSFMQWDGKSLPYIDNLVSLLVVGSGIQVADSEVQRVLAPNGVAIIDGRKTVKPRPDTIDEWTHWMRDASGNGVARDQVVGPPRHFQWIAKPYWSKHHDTVLTTSAMVSANGRVFYISNEAVPASIFSDAFDGNWFLVARDAFSGVLLWKRPIEDWGWKSWGESYHQRFAQPPQLASRLVAVGDTVYATLGFHHPVEAINAATGKTMRTYDSDYVDEILVHDGSLIVSSYTKEALKAFMAVKPRTSTSYRESRQDPQLVKDGPTVLKSVRRFDIDTGKLTWKRDGLAGLPVRYDSSQGYDRVYLTAEADRVVFLTSKTIQCLDLETGETRWEVARPEREPHIMNLGVRESENCILVNAEDVVIVGQPVGSKWGTFHTIPCDVLALDAKTGSELWKHRAGAWGWGSPPDVFVIDGRAWFHSHATSDQSWAGSGVPMPIQETMEYTLVGVDLHSGEVKQELSTQDINTMAHHHRCYRNKATEKFILSGRRGTELVDLNTGETWIQHWIRSECRYGAMPANGLLYSAPHPCGCYSGVLLKGYHATAGANSRPATMNQPAPDAGRLTKGPAFGSETDDAGTGWRTYRGDIGRSGYAATGLKQELSQKWKTKLGGDLTAITVADGRCFVASKETHTVHALDAAGGKPLWQHVAAARVDSPPTIRGNHVLFGSADGWVYCLNAADGDLVWKYLAAPREMMMVSDNRLESVWPVHGSVLVKEGEVYFMAGRSSYLDGGIWAYRLDAGSGALLEKKNIYSNDPVTDKQPDAEEAFTIEGLKSYVLASDGPSVYHANHPVFGDGRSGKPFVYANAGFLDDSLFVRSHQWTVAGGKVGAAMLVHDGKRAYGFKPFASTGRGTLHVAGTGYDVFCAPVKPEKQSRSKEKPARKGSKRINAIWNTNVDVLVRAMLLTGDALFIAGVPDTVDPDDPYAAFEGRKGAKLLRISTADGTVQETLQLEYDPAWDGLAADDGRLYIATTDGSLLCLEASP